MSPMELTNRIPPQNPEPGVRVNRIGAAAVPSAASKPLTVSEAPVSKKTVVPGRMVSVYWAGTVSWPLMRYCPLAGPHTSLPVSSPCTTVKALSVKQPWSVVLPSASLA